MKKLFEILNSYLVIVASFISYLLILILCNFYDGIIFFDVLQYIAGSLFFSYIAVIFIIWICKMIGVDEIMDREDKQ